MNPQLQTVPITQTYNKPITNAPHKKTITEHTHDGMMIRNVEKHGMKRFKGV